MMKKFDQAQRAVGSSKSDRVVLALFSNIRVAS